MQIPGMFTTVLIIGFISLTRVPQVQANFITDFLEKIKDKAFQQITICNECELNSTSSNTICISAANLTNTETNTTTPSMMTSTETATIISSDSLRQIDFYSTGILGLSIPKGLCARTKISFKSNVIGQVGLPGVCYTKFSKTGMILESGCTNKDHPQGCDQSDGERTCYCSGDFKVELEDFKDPDPLAAYNKVYKNLCNVLKTSPSDFPSIGVDLELSIILHMVISIPTLSSYVF